MTTTATAPATVAAPHQVFPLLNLTRIEEAMGRIQGQVKKTPLVRSETLERVVDNKNVDLYLKMESFQRTGAFKERGALNKLLLLTPEERASGVVAASAGNHAQGVAFHAGRLGVKATIVMPETTPMIKVQSTKDYGANVVLKGSNFDEAYAHALQVQKESGAVFVHPFNDFDVMCGQGTLGLELMEQNPYLDVIIVPIGGGGLISGILTAVKEVNPKIKVVGVQSAALPSMRAALDAGKVVTVNAGYTLADGLSVKRTGDNTFEVVRQLADEVVTVDEEEIADALLLLLEKEKILVEGAAASAFAAVLHNKVKCLNDNKRHRVAMIMSGGNIDVNVLAKVIERGLAKQGRLTKLNVKLPDRVGTLASLVSIIGECQANINEIFHNRAFSKTSYVGEIEVEITLETRGAEHCTQVITRLEQAGYSVTAITNPRSTN
eukprot:TRINITY_DN4883_c0_g3_i1.p1 TRINITY_DN4883_c0_g3~~TRINITY_DN4883_c0_g3_i1.p1  ORF type:complete len:448 (+),score=146.20 TRINITY_DN4883_c0_g3_i1:39-1346(+)